MLRKTFVEIDLAAVRWNLAQYKAALPVGGELMAVVKADGYGHGALEIAQVAESEGVAWAGVALVEEAVELREKGIRMPLLILGAWPTEALPYFAPYQITPTIHNLESAWALEHYCAKLGQPQKVHLKLDTGMGRLGLNAEQLQTFLAQRWEWLVVDGLDSHLACADDGQPEPTLTQLRRFWAAQEGVDAHFMPRWLHIANSAGTTEFDQDRGNLFRIGIGMYGQMPSSKLLRPPQLKQVLAFKAPVVQLQWFEPGSPLSYGGTFVTQRRTLVACVGVGYGDGYSRLLSGKAQVLVKGQRAPVLGRVCMDMTLVDVTDIPGVVLEDEVVLIGRQGAEEILAGELAAHMGTINYEVCCAISKRVPRVYRN
ncbi:MAG: alanine racemase [Candidatus Lambdaproteobacteria bacterium RIFOXYD1_FULL_56_27]|uniref:Alanine racemase n=1 Tax=Candidatus Lambdaproteobacteria bacterium RIFOXYD2_FULL_56_26 TaxID=1817773 RepID=A0A1F6H3V9_9PROT|nr:MAG: alanine racemase [Candidatus Lambdaproteobacteria bacterium RIFOXYC1_FULL_56_13]OGH05010.1 MAG: alanine racemase [Candidatus Lambdaproteobacteria bacterium RIFOXYD2_FULL_56_26]OGH09475.1 MAG: alanine racemase [Candidatus Lambdaproteobacteria bacterium RIFOXYD1_FULL_56_27]